MSLVSNIGSLYPFGSLTRATTTANLPARAVPAPSEDSIELSQVGRNLARAVEESSFRIARVRAIRGAVEIGVYETADRIDETVDRLLDVLA